MRISLCFIYNAINLSSTGLKVYGVCKEVYSSLYGTISTELFDLMRGRNKMLNIGSINLLKCL